MPLISDVERRDMRDNFIRLHTPEEALLGLLCEECGEVIKAAAKLERILRGETPTPETEGDWREQLQMEMNDVYNIARILGLTVNEQLQEPKMARWVERIKADIRCKKWRERHNAQDS